VGGGLQFLSPGETDGVFAQLSAWTGRSHANRVVRAAKTKDQELSFATFAAGDQTNVAILRRLLHYAQCDGAMAEAIELSLDDYPLLRTSIVLLRDLDLHLQQRAQDKSLPEEFVNDFWDVSIVALGAYADFVVTDRRLHDKINRLRQEFRKELPFKVRTKLRTCLIPSAHP
jgi:hypothetical protein